MTTFDDIEAALRKIAADNDLTYVSFDLHCSDRQYFSCKAHRGQLAKQGIGATIEAALAKALAEDFLDTAPLSAERDRIEAAGREALTLAKGGRV